MKTLLTNYLEYGLALAVAAAGGMIRVLTTQKSKTASLCAAGVELLVAGFAGVLVNALCLEFKVDSELKVVLVAISGYTSREVIALIKQAALSAIRLILKQNVPAEKPDREKEK